MEENIFKYQLTLIDKQYICCVCIHASNRIEGYSLGLTSEEKGKKTCY